MPDAMMMFMSAAVIAGPPTLMPRQRSITPIVGPPDDPLPTRLHWLKTAMRLLMDQCAGRVPLTPNSDLKLPCGGRDLLGAALSVLDISEGNDTAACMAYLRKLPGPEISFGGQAWPAIWYRYSHRFSPADRAWIAQQINHTAEVSMKNLSHSWVKSAAGNVGVDVSYNNMYYMNMVNTVLMGEIAANRAAADMGYRMVDNWLRYVQIAGLHEFSSPTYYWVQINALYVGYMYAKRPGARALFGAILDHTWADIAANYFAPSQTISGPESRDYDFLYGHGALMVHLYAQGFPGMTNGSLVCEWKDTHCERNDAGQNAYALHNQLFADGYRPSASIRRLSVAPYREVSGTGRGPPCPAACRASHYRALARPCLYVRAWMCGCAHARWYTCSTFARCAVPSLGSEWTPTASCAPSPSATTMSPTTRTRSARPRRTTSRTRTQSTSRARRISCSRWHHGSLTPDASRETDSSP